MKNKYVALVFSLLIACWSEAGVEKILRASVNFEHLFTI